jgi:predicted AlkP superfamily pyrophosphatase or phosphodiesterase
MIHDEDGDLIKEQSSDENFLYPNYKQKCISNIPGTILDLFGVKNNRKLPSNNWAAEWTNKVVFIVLDGFGYNQFLRLYREHKFLTNLAKKGEVFPLTSIFPSQTTNALTTLNTGLTPQEHGLFEYYIYLKEIDMIVNTLRFEPIGSKHRNELIENGFNPAKMFKKKTIYKALRKSGIKTFTYIFTSYAYSPYSQLLYNESTIIPSLKSSDLIVNLRKNLEKEDEPAYFFVHLSNLDTIAHEYGPSSYEYNAELSMISYLLQKELVEKIDQKTAKETLVLIAADHGGVNIVPEKTTYLNWFPDIVENLQYSKKGQRILLTGSPRDVFLHIREEKLMETKNLLKQKIGPKAKIIETGEAIRDGLFGLGDVGNEFIDRAGNLLILPYRNETVWFEHSKNRRVVLHGHHGGLNEEEMLVPFAITKLNNLK